MTAPTPTRPCTVHPGLPAESLRSVLRDRLEPAGWVWRRDVMMGREEWIEPALPAGQREPRTVRVDELWAGASGVVVEGCNGHERLVIRCVPDTSTAVVLVTLDLWRMLPDTATTTPAASAASAASAPEQVPVGVTADA